MDYFEIKKIIKDPLIKNHYDKTHGFYYLLNYEWFKTFLETNNMINIYEYMINNKIIENISNYDRLSFDQQLYMIISNIDKKEFSQMNINEKDNNKIKNYELFNLKYNNIKNEKRNIKYIYDFLLLKEDTYKLFAKDLNINYRNEQYNCLFGDNKIFLILQDDSQFILEVGYINNNNDFIIELFLDYNSEKILKDNIISIIDKGYTEYCSSSLLIRSKDDFVSPIFDENMKIIGYAYKYINNSLINYEDYIINEHLKNLISLYLYDFQLIKTIESKELE